MTEKKTALVTGANRGIGLGLASQFLAHGYEVLATARNPDGARELWELEADYKGRCRIVELDVMSDASVDALAKSLAGRALDVLINNAGVSADSGKPLPDVTAEACLKVFDVNAVGPLRVTRRLLPSLQASRRPIVATISSMMGSVAMNESGRGYPYRMAKAAVNMFNKSLAVDYPDLIAVVLHPGWVQTDMGGEKAPVKVLDSAGGLYRVVAGLTTKDSGKFYDFKGEVLPW